MPRPVDEIREDLKDAVDNEAWWVIDTLEQELEEAERHTLTEDK